MNRLRILFTIACVLVIGSLILILIKNNIVTKQKITTNTPLSSPVSASFKPYAIATAISKPLSQTKSFPHELLPGFNITIPSSWYISDIKQFGEKDDVGFTSNYFTNGLPNENSMAARIFKNGTFFDLIFDIIFDDYGISCSDDNNTTDIGKGWYRISNDLQTFYAKNVEFNVKNIYTPNSKVYKSCIVGSGILTSVVVPKIVSPEGAMKLEHIRVYGTPSEKDLNEIDSIVRSIIF